jgi:hypothetical protein
MGKNPMETNPTGITTNSNSETWPLRLQLPTPPQRLKLREAMSGKPGGYVT